MNEAQRAAKLKTRINTEKRITRKVVEVLLRAGFQLEIDNGGDEPEVRWTRNEAKLRKGLQLTDEEHLRTEKDGKLGWIHFVYGNDGYDVISDYTVNLEEYLGEGTEVDQLARKLEHKMLGLPAPEPGRPCAMWLMCANEATTTVPHPVLGEVSSCLRCKNRYESLK